MVGARTAARGLSPADLDGIRETLAAGRRPKVMFTETAGQIAGQVGQVVKLGDPAGGDEFVVVRFGRDELPFSPSDLAIPARGAARRAEPATNGRPAANGRPAGKPARPDAAKSAEVETAPPPVPAPRAEPAPQAAKPDPAASEPPARKATRPPKPPKPPAALMVTLAYADGEWTVAATQGTKALAKPYLIRPAEALKMVALLDVPGVHEAVEQIVAAERAVAQDQAQRLRSQLAEVEARLAELGELG